MRKKLDKKNLLVVWIDVDLPLAPISLSENIKLLLFSWVEIVWWLSDFLKISKYNCLAELKLFGDFLKISNYNCLAELKLFGDFVTDLNIVN